MRFGGKAAFAAGGAMRLKDKVAIMTGAASGIGKEIALTFAREAAKLAIADLNKGRPDRSRTKLPMPEVGRWPSPWM